MTDTVWEIIVIAAPVLVSSPKAAGCTMVCSPSADTNKKYLRFHLPKCIHTIILFYVDYSTMTLKSKQNHLCNTCII